MNATKSATTTITAHDGVLTFEDGRQAYGTVEQPRGGVGICSGCNRVVLWAD